MKVDTNSLTLLFLNHGLTGPQTGRRVSTQRLTVKYD